MNCSRFSTPRLPLKTTKRLRFGLEFADEMEVRSFLAHLTTHCFPRTVERLFAVDRSKQCEGEGRLDCDALLTNTPLPPNPS